MKDWGGVAGEYADFMRNAPFPGMFWQETGPLCKQVKIEAASLVNSEE